MRLEVRPAPSRLWSVLSPVVALAITVAVAATLFAALGKDPVQGLEIFLVKPWSGTRALTELGLKATPLILIALGLALAFRANVWNIGAEGQYLVGGIVGGGLALLVTENQIPVDRLAFFPILVLAGALGGMVWASIAAFLKDRFNANEILVSLMLVYVADLFLSWLVFGPWKDPKGFNFPQTMNFAANTGVPRLVPGMRLHWGFVLAMLGALAMWVFMFRTYRGMQILVGGPAPAAARYAGFSARVALWSTFLISGALAGIAGALEVAGPMGQLTPHVSQGYGFAAIIVAFVGRLHPLGAVLASLVLATFSIGGELSQSRLGLPAAITGVFQGVLLLALLGCDTLIQYRPRWTSR